MDGWSGKLSVVGLAVGTALLVACAPVSGETPSAPEPSTPQAREPVESIGPEEAMALNEAYRQRSTPDRDSRRQARRQRPAVLAALRPLVDGDAVRPGEVSTALEAAGFDAWQLQTTDGRGAAGDPVSSIGFGITVGRACITGGVWPDRLSAEVTGPIADGGCLEMPTH